MSAFDPETFLSTTISGSLDTEVTPIPMGEYPGTVEKIGARSLAAKDGNPERFILEVTWELEDTDGEIESATRRKKNTCRQSIWLDTTAEGGLDMSPGSNVSLGQLRDAVGQNGADFWTFQMLVGQRAMCNVSHSTRDGTTFANVKNVRALS